jgi:hypothetical protein
MKLFCIKERNNEVFIQGKNIRIACASAKYWQCATVMEMNNLDKMLLFI